MSWSTRELADMAGTTVNTIRHYHRLGLLDEPERRLNGYKQYELPHLVRLLRIRRLVELGLPLAHIAAFSTPDDDAHRALLQLDADLAAQIERLTQARTDVAEILRDNAPADVPAGFTSVASHLSEPDSAILHLSTRLFDDEALGDLRHMIETDAHSDAFGQALAELPADADERMREQLAGRLAPALARNLDTYPWLTEPAGHLSRRGRITQRTFIEAMFELYSPAQLDVLARATVLARERPARPPT